MKKLKKVYIEITNVCNLSCAFCPGTSRKPGFMSAADFETVLQRLCGFTEYVYFHVMGEPLLHPEVAHFLELCGTYGYRVNITTNGLLIRKQTEALIDSRALRQVNFSLHSQEEVSDAAKLENYFEDILEFTDRALEKGSIYVSYRLWNLSSEAAGQYNAFVARKLEQHFSPGFPIFEALSKASRIKICKNLFLNSAEVFQWPSMMADETGGEGFCLGLRDQAAILADGTAVPCCLDSGGIIKLGNIFERDFQQILNGERARALYEGFSGKRAVEELCRRCGYRTRFSKDSL